MSAKPLGSISRRTPTARCSPVGVSAQRMGFGDRPAVVAIDCQRYMVGERGVRDEPLPLVLRRRRLGGRGPDRGRFSSRARGGRACVPHALRARSERRRHRRLCPQARFLHRAGLVPRGDGRRGAVAGGRAPRPATSCSSRRSRAPSSARRSSAYSIDRTVDTVVVIGGATSNCVRATVFDSASYNFRTIVPERRGLRPPADLARDQSVRHGSSVRGRDVSRRSDRRTASKAAAVAISRRRGMRSAGRSN